jgi:hypothetical protein
MEDKVKVRSLVSCRVILSDPELRVHRVWEKKNTIKIIPLEQLEQLIYEPGVMDLFTDGVLGIDDMEVKIHLGLEPDGAEKPVNIIILDDAQRERYLRNMPAHEFKQKVKELPTEQQMELVQYAIEHEIADFEKAEFLEKLTDINIISAIKLNRDDKEGAKEAK